MGRYTDYPTEKQEKWYEAKIWVLLLTVGGLLFVFSTRLLGEEIFYRITGETMVVEATSAVILHADDGTTFAIDLVGQQIQRNKDGSITLYYRNGDITTAKGMTSWKFWIAIYVMIIPMVFVSLHKIFKIYKPGKKK